MISFSKAKLTGLAFLAVVGFLFSADVTSFLVWRVASSFFQIVGSTVASLMVVMSGTALWLAIAKLVDRTPALVIDSMGLTDRTTLPAVGRVEWTDVRTVRVWRYWFVNYLCIDLHDPRPFVSRGNAVQRFIRTSAMRSGGGAICLTSLMLDIRFGRLTQTVRRFFDQAKAPLSITPSGV
ncbi:MAG: hypothetical protein HYX38_27465 [Rhodospirillales bacterium]|nr:hypothetical protein [Rhodospirillales bacterium]